MMYICSGMVLLSILFIYWSLRHAWWRPNINLLYPRILMYHMVSPHLPKKQSKFNRLRVTPKEFEKQLQWLKENGWTSLTMSELTHMKTSPAKTVVLTFDDGYADNYTQAFPLLKKYAMKATIYLVVNRFDRSWAQDKDTKQSSQELNNEAMLTSEMVFEMLSSGLVEFGSHTLNHVNLPLQTTEQKQAEIQESKQILETHYGITCNSFAYPFGFYDSHDISYVKQSGYTNAVTTHNGYEPWNEANKYEIKRVMISGKQKLFDFQLKLLKGQNR